MLNASKTPSFSFKWFQHWILNGNLVRNVLLHPYCIHAWIILKSFYLYSVGKQQRPSWQGLVQRTEGTFPFTYFNAHIQFEHYIKEKERKEKRKDRKKFFHLDEVEKLADWERENAIEAYGNIHHYRFPLQLKVQRILWGARCPQFREGLSKQRWICMMYQSCHVQEYLCNLQK